MFFGNPCSLLLILLSSLLFKKCFSGIFLLYVYIDLVGYEEMERKEKKRRQYILAAGIHQSKKERE